MASPQERPSTLLSPIDYDDDARSIHSDRSEQDTDSEDDQLINRTSTEIREHDRTVLLEEEERDRLLEESRRRLNRRGSALNLAAPIKNLFTKHSNSSTDVFVDEPELESSKSRRKQRRERRKKHKDQLLAEAADGEDGQLMFEMEEGGMKDGSSTGSSSDAETSGEYDRQTLQGVQNEKIRRRRKFRNMCFLHALIAVGFTILVLIAYRLSMNRRPTRQGQVMFNNGTALFAPTTILLSLDGFRADFLNRGLTPRLNAFIAEGVSPPYMNPSFPSVTFPNHYTLVTGLYPESHGVVGNTFWDPEFQEEFYYTDAAHSMQPKWWGGEPLWVTAEKQGIRCAVHMWPGSEAHIAALEPSFIDKYNGQEKLDRKVDRILQWLDRPGQEDPTAMLSEMRPQLIAAYVPNVDADGHRYGPNSTEIRATISDVDSMLDKLFLGLEERNLTDVVNVVVVSDHGMATTDTDRLLQLEDLVDVDKIEHTDGWPLYGLRPKDPSDLMPLYDSLAAQAADNPNFDVYLRDVNMPERYHFSKNDRIAPLWIVPKTGWAIVQKHEFDVVAGKSEDLIYHPRGLHGYDHEHPLMRAIFIARGPAFPHAPNSRLDPFQNTNVYNIICDSLHLEPIANNGTLRLPLQPVGQHDSGSRPEDPLDPVPPNGGASSTNNDDDIGSDVISISPIEASSAANPNNRPPHLVGVDRPSDDDDDDDDPFEDAAEKAEEAAEAIEEAAEEAAEEAEDAAEEAAEKAEEAAKGWWAYLKGKLDEWKEWLSSQSSSSEEAAGGTS